MDDDGLAGDWIFEDKVIYVHKRFVAIPLVATPGGDLAKLRPDGHGDDAGDGR